MEMKRVCEMKRAISAIFVIIILFALTGCGTEQQSFSIDYGEEMKLTLSKDYPEIAWTSSDPTIVAIDGGTVTGVGPGEAKITGTSNGKTVAEITITVNIIDITGIFLNQSAMTIEAGEEVQLQYSLVPENASDFGIHWKSANDSVATVSDQGLIHAIGTGTTTIICSSMTGEMSVCEVTVKAPSAAELLNERESGLFNYLTTTMLNSFYNAPAFRIRNIYGYAKDADSVYTLDIQGMNRVGGTLFKQYVIMISNGAYSYMDVSDYFNRSGVEPMDTNILDYSKINAALEEYWSESSMG